MKGPLTSLQNPRVKHVRKLRDRKERDRSGQFLIEGYRELLRAVDAKKQIETLFFCEELFLGENEKKLISRLDVTGAEVVSCKESVFRKMSYRDRPDGLIAVAKQLHTTLDQITLNNRLILVAEAIEKPGNLGTILRSADAAGADALIVCDRCTDIHNPNVVRASVGTLFTVPVVETSGKEALSWLKTHGFSVLAATPSAREVYTDVDMTHPIALAIGTEQLGLSEFWMETCDQQVKIPMLGIADSLNVATATALLLYEALRQRRKT